MYVGKGLMGTVRACRTKGGKYFAMKIISKDFVERHRDERHVLNERNILFLVSSPFCIKIFGAFQVNYFFFKEKTL